MKHFGLNLQYKDTQDAIYRGIKSDYYKVEDYRINRFNCWPGFTSTTKKKETAIGYSRNNSINNPAVYFKIYTNLANSGVASTIDTDKA